MLKENVWCVIMAGGSDNLRQNLSATLERFASLVPPERTIVVSNTHNCDSIRADFPDFPAQNLLAEPRNRDTAPCIALAMYTILKRDPEGIMIVTPVDHRIDNPEKFSAIMTKVTADVVGHDIIITLGITPTGPKTGFGYIQTVGYPQMDTPAKVKTFVEKPSEHFAEIFVDSGEFLWNSGIFVCVAESLHQVMKRLQYPITSLFKGWQGALDSPAQQSFIDGVYADMPRISIDRGIMERYHDIWVLPCEFGWSDKCKE